MERGAKLFGEGSGKGGKPHVVAEIVCSDRYSQLKSSGLLRIVASLGYEVNHYIVNNFSVPRNYKHCKW